MEWRCATRINETWQNLTEKKAMMIDHEPNKPPLATITRIHCWTAILEQPRAWDPRVDVTSQMPAKLRANCNDLSEDV